VDLPPVDTAILSDLNLRSRTAFLINTNTGEVLLDIDANRRMYPASMVKMMTTLVAIENLNDLSENIFFSPTIFPPLREIGASIARFVPHEAAPAFDVLMGIMLPSGGDASVAMARHIAGSEREFVTLMNRRAEEIGMHGTNFANSSGLPHANQYTTAEDMALLLAYALQNETFRDIITQSTHTTQPTNRQAEGRVLGSTLFGRMDTAYYGGGYILGGRTGFTFAAGQTLASFTEIYGEIYILVTMGAFPPSSGRYTWHIDDAVVVYSTLFQLMQ